MVGPGCIIGYPHPADQAQFTQGADYFEALDAASAGCTINSGSTLRSNVVIYAGTVLGPEADVAHNVVIREDSVVGANCYLMSGLQVMANVKIGRRCRMAGTICNRAEVGDGSSALGHLMHRYSSGLGGLREEAPKLGRAVIVGRESSVVGGVVIDDYAIIGAGASVSKDVPARQIWIGSPARMIGLRDEEEIARIQVEMGWA